MSVIEERLAGWGMMCPPPPPCPLDACSHSTGVIAPSPPPPPPAPIELPVTQYGCGESLASDRTTEVATAATGYGGTVTACRDYCNSEGFDFFGLGCPSATKTVCQCYTDDKLKTQGLTLFPKTESCANPAGMCDATSSVSFNSKSYSLGGSNKAAIYGTWYNSMSVQHGCGEGLVSDKTSEVATATEGYGGTITACKEFCKGEGFPFFGLGCPSATKTLCQCYSQSKIDSAGLGTAETKSCANPAGECTATNQIWFQSTQYSLGGANKAAVYAVDSGHSGRRKLDLLSEGCEPPGSFVHIKFDEAKVVHSNLGGIGGQCDEAYWSTPEEKELYRCTGPQISASTPHEIYITNIGKNNELEPLYKNDDDGVPYQQTNIGAVIDLRITNLTEYRAWEAGGLKWNGLKRADKDGHTAGAFGSGSFGNVNLKGPRSATQSWPWYTTAGTLRPATYVELLYEFVTGSAKTEITLPRTFMTFYDLDTGRASGDFADNSVEAMQMDPDASRKPYRTADSELKKYNDWTTYLMGAEGNTDMITELLPDPADRARLGSWSADVFVATQYGIGPDNPIDTYEMTDLQKRRSVMIEFENVKSFKVRYAIIYCCTTGRNFLYGGYSAVRPLCPYPPPLPPPPSPPPPTPPPLRFNRRGATTGW